MSADPIRDLTDAAVEIGWRAGRRTLAHFQTGATIETKADASPVTIADREAEQVARGLIERWFPDDGILGEEYGEVRPEARRRWVLDPIDGTKSFIHGVPLYGVLVALEEDGVPLVGVLHFPALDETVHAARGEGCRWNGRRAGVSRTDRIEDALVVTTDAEAIPRDRPAARWDRLRSRARLVRTWGDAYGYALVATGRADAMLDPVVAHWDAAPLKPVIEEAGGVFTDWNGRDSLPVQHAVATNDALARPVRRMLEKEES